MMLVLDAPEHPKPLIREAGITKTNIREAEHMDMLAWRGFSSICKVRNHRNDSWKQAGEKIVRCVYICEAIDIFGVLSVD